MPITYRVDHERRVVVARGYGVITHDDLFGYQRAAWSGSDVVGSVELVDMTDVSEIIPPSADHVQALATVAAHMDLASTPSRFAIVAPGDNAYGLGRMFQAYRESETRSTKAVGVFRTFSEALEFLRINHPLPLPPIPPEAGAEDP